MPYRAFLRLLYPRRWGFRAAPTRHAIALFLSPLTLAPLAPLHAAPAPPEWIWHPNNGHPPADGERRFFRKVFVLDQTVSRASLVAAADNHFTAHLNGQKAAEGNDWAAPVRANVTQFLRPGTNVLAVEARNDGGVAALLLRLDLSFGGGRRESILTDASWQTATQSAAGWLEPGFTAADWVAARPLGKLGTDPWGDVLANSRPGRGSGNAPSGQATPADKITTLPGFKVELLRSAVGDEGSWIAMTIDPKGRLIISPQNAKQPLLRFTIDHGNITRQETIDLGVGEAMGLLCAFDSLYANAKGPQGTGLYRLRDTNNDDQFDKVEFLKTMHGGGEHGPHGVVLGPDQRLYVINGNHTKVPDALSPLSPHQGYAEDHLLPRDWDGNGHARGILAPGGHLARTDADGHTWELLLAGFRNAYDFDINDEGEIFTFDSDMEWDWGMPWYRPTAVYHCVSAADYGWRSGTGKWPWYYPDALPPATQVGLGSPTGVKFGRGARFPTSYQRALYVMDWSYGRILAIHLKPSGASYLGHMEPFVVGRPLNVSDLEIGRDGAMYFTTGGRGTQSGLYRLSYHGNDNTAPVKLTDTQGAEARALRRRLEAFHGRVDPAALDAAWPHLDHPDRFIRYAARLAVESQPVAGWKDRALQETSIQGSLTALLALARKASSDTQTPLLESLQRHWPDGLNDQQKIEALRAGSLALIRMGRPEQDVINDLIAAINPLFPSSNPLLNRELSQVLIYLEAPDAVEKCLALMEAAPTQEDQIHYLFSLRTLKKGWTPEQRRRYFSWYHRSRAGLKHPPEILQWFADVGRDYTDGASFPKFLENFKRTAVATLTDAERTALASVLDGKESAPPPVAAVPRPFVKEWTLEQLLPLIDRAGRGRSFDKGRDAFVGAQCIACHKFGNEGGATGQELTAVASRYSRRDILESILLPSKIVSEQYQNTTFYLNDGDDVTGRVVDEKEGKLVVLVDPINQRKVEVPKAQIKQQALAQLSPMPEGLLNVLTQDEILDLIAYLESGGRRDHSAFAPQKDAAR